MTAIIIFFILLFVLSVIIAKRYDDKKNRLAEHEKSGGISPAHSPESVARGDLRKYTVKYRKNGFTYTTRIEAQSYLDAKYQTVIQHDVDVKSILSVV